jgi:hypothetical protein
VNDAEIIAAAAAELSSLKDKPWMTARGLARRLRRSPTCRVSQARLYQALIEHARKGEGNRRIRNSRLPSAKTLEVLWGSIERVGEMDVDSPLANLTLDGVHAAASGDQLREFPDGDPDFFLSYSLSDEPAAREIVEILEAKGHSVWMAGARIVQDDDIHERVIHALDRSERLLLYLSARSLESGWVHKELNSSRSLERVIVIKGDDPALPETVRRATVVERSELPRPGNSTERAAEQFRGFLSDYLSHSDRPVYLHPVGGDINRQRFRSLDDFPVATPSPGSPPVSPGPPHRRPSGPRASET